MKRFSLRENITEILAIMGLSMSFLFLMTLIFIEIPEKNKELINTCVGFIIGISINGVMGYYFGTSKKRDFIPIEPGQSVTNIQKSIVTEIPESKEIEELNYQLGKAKTSGNLGEVERIQKLIDATKK